VRADVLVIGAGPAGLAAAHALAADGAKVTLLERRAYVGGRAYSYLHPALEEVVDSQHVLLGCCTNLIHLLEASGAAGTVRWYDEFHFMEPGGRVSTIRPGALPSPMHSALSFLRAPMLGFADRRAIARGMMEFLRGRPSSDDESLAQWLARTGQTNRATRHFWEPVVVGTLNDVPSRCSMRYAGQVFHEAFLRSAKGGRFGVPRVPLSEMYGAVAASAEQKGCRFVARAGVERLEQTPDGWRAKTSGGEFEAAKIILALPFEQAQTLFARLPESASRTGMLERLANFVHAPITTIHLWWDRDVTGMDHAALVDTRIQWMFNKTRIRGAETAGGHYVELDISASAAELAMGREEIVSSAVKEMALFFPRVLDAELLKCGVLKEARATFSVVPGLDESRPAAATAWPGLFVAGDWTRTGWPSTMEGAVRSGYLAAGAVAGKSYLQPDLVPSGLMRWLVQG